jgi:hypothetical protein
MRTPTTGLSAHLTAGAGDLGRAPAESRIAALGSAQAVIDTSAEAAGLIDRYRRRGYAPAGTWPRDVTDYDSVVLAKNLPTV